MAGYANRILTRTYPDLSEPGDLVSVTIRNPRTVAPSELIPPPVALGPDGEPIDIEEANRAGHVVLARLIIGWHVYDSTVGGYTLDDDGTVTAGEQPLLALPATPELVGKLPADIQLDLARAIEEAANPSSTTPQTPTGTTSA